MEVEIACCLVVGQVGAVCQREALDFLTLSPLKATPESSQPNLVNSGQLKSSQHESSQVETTRQEVTLANTEDGASDSFLVRGRLCVRRCHGCGRMDDGRGVVDSLVDGWRSDRGGCAERVRTPRGETRVRVHGARGALIGITMIVKGHWEWGLGSVANTTIPDVV